MAISVQCSRCRKRLKAKEELTGKRVRCPSCGQVIIVRGAHSSSQPKVGSARTPPVSPPDSNPFAFEESDRGAQLANEELDARLHTRQLKYKRERLKNACYATMGGGCGLILLAIFLAFVTLSVTGGNDVVLAWGAAASGALMLLGGFLKLIRVLVMRDATVDSAEEP